MRRIIALIVATPLLFGSQAVLAGDAQEANTPGMANIDDPRQLVSMPERARLLMRDHMLDNLAALNEIIGLLASGDLDAAADVAENRMGRSAMGKHRGSGMGPGPGKFMPDEMRKLAWGMHESASEFSRVARQGDIQGAHAALQKVTTACVACHYSYRTQ
ncbi:MAG: cytochrome c [Gammaproteobacteria bacterium]